jgi:hypothetical protein
LCCSEFREGALGGVLDDDHRQALESEFEKVRKAITWTSNCFVAEVNQALAA